MGFQDEARVRVSGRLAALAMARACAAGLFSGTAPEEGAAAAGLFLAGQPQGGPGEVTALPEQAVWLMAAGAQVCAAVLYRLAREKAGREPSLAEVMEACDELEAGLLAAG